MAPDRVIAVVLAAGEGRRMGAPGNKVYLAVAGRPILDWSLALFEGSADVDATVLVSAASELEACRRRVEAGAYRKVVQVVAGGATRQDSEWNGLLAASDASGTGTGIVLVHDAVRPFATGDLLSRLIAEARAHGGAIPAVPAPAGLVTTVGGQVAGYPTGLWAVQTPQAFRLGELVDAHRRARDHGVRATDTAAIYERAGGTVRVVESSPDNLKVTTPADLGRAELIARRRAS